MKFEDIVGKFMGTAVILYIVLGSIFVFNHVVHEKENALKWATL